MRVLSTGVDGDKASKGYEIISANGNTAQLNGDSNGNITNLYYKADNAHYTKAMAPGATTWTWSEALGANNNTFTNTDGNREFITITDHDWKICEDAASAKITIDGDPYYKTASESTVIGVAGTGLYCG